MDSEPSTSATLLSLSSGDSVIAAENAASAIAAYQASGDLVTADAAKSRPLLPVG